MKRFVSILLSLALLCALVVPVSAESPQRSPIHRSLILLIGSRPVLYVQVQSPYSVLADTASLTVECDTDNSDYCQTYSHSDMRVTTAQTPDVGMELLIPMRDPDNFPVHERLMLTFPAGTFVSQSGTPSEECSRYNDGTVDFELSTNADAVFCNLLMRRYAGTDILPMDQGAYFQIEAEYSNSFQGVPEALQERMQIRSDSGTTEPGKLQFDTSTPGETTQTLLFDGLPLLDYKLDVLSAETVKKYVIPDKLLRWGGSGLFCLTLPLFVIGGIPAGWVMTCILCIAFIGTLPLLPVLVPTMGTFSGIKTGFEFWLDRLKRIKPDY